MGGGRPGDQRGQEMGLVPPPAGPGCSGLGFLLGKPISGAGRGCVISWLKSRLLAVTLLASLGARHAGNGGRGRGGERAEKGLSPKAGCPSGAGPVSQAPSVPWPGQARDILAPHSSGQAACCPQPGAPDRGWAGPVFGLVESRTF